MSGSISQETQPITPDVALRQWRLRARKHQQYFYDSFGNKFYRQVPDVHLKKFIGFALHGQPTEMENGNLTYSSDADKRIDKLIEFIFHLRKGKKFREKGSNSNITSIAVLHIYSRCKDGDCNEYVSIVFRVLFGKPTDSNFDNFFFVDSVCRSYNDWNDYMTKCTLGKCDMCVPKGGIYAEVRGRVELTFQESPACKLGNRMLNVADNTIAVVGVGAVCVGVAALAFPISVPIILGADALIMASGSYETWRNVSKLVDRGKHDENLNFFSDPKARGLWLGLATSTLGVAAKGGKVLGKAGAIFKSGEVIGKTESSLLRIVNVSSAIVSGANLLDSLITGALKYRHGSLDREDVLRFINALYFFTNALITPEVAKWLIGSVAANDPLSIFMSSRNKFDLFDEIIDIRNNGHFKLLVELIGGNKYLPRIDVSQVDKIVRTIITSVRDVSSGRIRWDKFAITMSQESEKLWQMFKDPIREALNRLLVLNNVGNGESIFFSPAQEEIVLSKPDIARQLCLNVHNVIVNCIREDTDGLFMRDILRLILDFNARYQENFSIEFLERSKFVCEYVSNKFYKLIDEYEFKRDIAESNADVFDEKEFDESFGIDRDMDFRSCFLAKVIYSLHFSMSDMKDDYAELSNDYKFPSGDPPCYQNEAGSSYLYDCESIYTEEDYWKLLITVTGLNFNADNAIMLTVDDKVFIQPKDKDSEIKIISFINIEDENGTIGILNVIKIERDWATML